VAALLTAMAWTMPELEEVIEKNGKQRFELSVDKARIRASQGHSVDVDLGYEEREPPAALYHGTSRSLLETLVAEGLKKMSRHHVHLSADVATARIVARRRPGPSIVLEVRADRMASDGHKFYLSTNGVWLTDHVPASYFHVTGE
jgi:putative RNA 2'-phosphotransferase